MVMKQQQAAARPSMTALPPVVLFDWDNTLVDTWPVIHQALHNTFTALGREPWTLEMTKKRVRRSMRDAFPEVFGENWEEAGTIYQQHYRALHLNDLQPLPGAESVLRFLRTQPVYVAVVSNKRGENLRKEIAHLDWGGYFDTVVGADDAARDKPHPDPVELALAGSPHAPGPDVWFIGDSEIDLECARNTGCHPVLYGDYPHEELSAQAGHFRGFPYARHARDHAALERLLRGE